MRSIRWGCRGAGRTPAPFCKGVKGCAPLQKEADDTTLGEGKRKVLMLIDEYSSGGTLTVDKDLEARMADFFDLAQKNIAGYKRIVRRFVPGTEDGGPSSVTASGRATFPQGKAKGTRTAGTAPAPSSVSPQGETLESTGFTPGDLSEMKGAPGGCGAFVGEAPADFGQVFRVWKDGKLTRAYAWSGKSILLPATDVGRVEVEYFAVPRTIPQDAPDDYEFEVDEEAAACMPYFVAAQQLVVDLVVDHTPLLELYDRMVKALDLRLPESGGGGIRQGFYSGGRRRGLWRGGQG